MRIQDRFSVQGKTAIVTGASSGLGVTMAEGLAEAGANVVLSARRAENLEQLAARIQASGGKALAKACDVGDSAQVKALVDAANARFGRVDILVNNAGTAADAGVMPEKVTDEMFETTMRANLNGTFYCAREVAQHMLRDGKGGAIINIASIYGMGGAQNGPVAYQSSKAAVINLTRTLALSWMDRGIRVNCIAPGWFPSEMTGPWFAVPEFNYRFSHQVPQVCIGDPDELVGALLFFASAASSFVSGQTLAVDGGYTASHGAVAYDDHLFEVMATVLGSERIMPA